MNEIIDEEVVDLTDWPSNLTDEQLGGVYCCGDMLDFEESILVEAEIVKRGLNVKEFDCMSFYSNE